MSELENNSVLVLTIDNQISEIARMTVWLDKELRKFNATPEMLFNFDLCANEVADNIISYAYPNGGEHVVTLRLEVDSNKITLEFEDDGIPFNFLEATDHVRPENLEKAKIGGLGIYLTKHYMDECEYIRRDDKNVLKIITYLSPTSDVSDNEK